MAWEFLQKIPSPLKTLQSFRVGGRWFETGDPCDWMKLAMGVRQVYKLIHDGFLENPFDEPSKSAAKRVKIQTKKKKKKVAKKPKPKE